MRLIRLALMLILIGACGRCRMEPLAEPADAGEVVGMSDATADSSSGADAAAPDTDAAAPDTDAAADAGDPAGDDCATRHPGAIVCESFDDPALSGWTVVAPTFGVVEVQGARTLRGSGALHARARAGDTPAMVEREFPRTGTGELHVRAHIYLESAPTGEVTLAGLSARASAGGATIAVNRSGGLYSWLAEPGMSTETGRGAVPTGRWFCARLSISIDSAAGTASIRVDDGPSGMINGIDTLPAMGFETFVIGIPWAMSGLPELDVWMDELVIDDAPIPCEL